MNMCISIKIKISLFARENLTYILWDKRMTKQIQCKFEKIKSIICLKSSGALEITSLTFGLLVFHH